MTIMTSAGSNTIAESWHPSLSYCHVIRQLQTSFCAFNLPFHAAANQTFSILQDLFAQA